MKYHAYKAPLISGAGRRHTYRIHTLMWNMKYIKKELCFALWCGTSLPAFPFNQTGGGMIREFQADFAQDGNLQADVTSEVTQKIFPSIFLRDSVLNSFTQPPTQVRRDCPSAQGAAPGEFCPSSTQHMLSCVPLLRHLSSFHPLHSRAQVVPLPNGNKPYAISFPSPSCSLFLIPSDTPA